MSIFAANMNHRSFWWQISALCFVLGLLLASAWNTTGQLTRAGFASNRDGFYYGNGARDAAEEAAHYQSEIKKLRERNTELENVNAKGHGAASAINKELQETKFVAGLTEAEGPGVIVTLRDSQKHSNDPSLINRMGLLIHDEDIDRVVNELKASGAEAISVNGQRIVASTAIRCVGPVVQVNGVPSAPPVVIKAIGSPDTLSTGLNIRDGIMDMFRSLDPAMAKLEKAKILHIPAFAGSTTARYARLPKTVQKDDDK